MSDDRLTYLQDHLAGARFAVELLEELSQQTLDTEAASLAAHLVAEIASDREALEQIVESLGGDASGAKDVAAWVAQKATRFKLDVTTRLGLFESLEFLCLGVQGKIALWNALASAAGSQGAEIERLKARALRQHEALETLRLKRAASLLAGWDRQADCREHETKLHAWAQEHGVDLQRRAFAAGKVGEFDGTTLAINSAYGAEQRLYYAVHALGSIAIWTRDRNGVKQMFDELRDAKREKSASPERLANAIEHYRAFETASSQHAVWIVEQIGADAFIPSYSNFMRADLEAMTQFQQNGKAPVWKEFFDSWNAEVAAGKRHVSAFEKKDAADFKAIAIDRQQIVQRQ